MKIQIVWPQQFGCFSCKSIFVKKYIILAAINMMGHIQCNGAGCPILCFEGCQVHPPAVVVTHQWANCKWWNIDVNNIHDIGQVQVHQCANCKWWNIDVNNIHDIGQVQVHQCASCQVHHPQYCGKDGDLQQIRIYRDISEHFTISSEYIFIVLFIYLSHKKRISSTPA